MPSEPHQPNASPAPADSGGTASPPSGGGRVIRATGLTKLTGALVFLSFLPLVVAFFMNLWAKEYYQFYPLALAGAAFFAWTRFKEVPMPLQTGLSLVSITLLGGAFLVLAAGTVLWSPWLGMVALMVGLVGGLWWVGGWPLLRAMLPALVMLAIVVPPPLNLDVRLTMKLRQWATEWSCTVLDLLSITHSRTGNTIEIPNQRLLVEEACSGINSILSTTAVCLFYCLWRRRNIPHLVMAVPLTWSFVLMGNVVRIVSGAYLRFHHNIDILTGWKHETVGLVLFASYLGLILSLDQFLAFLFEPPEERGDKTVPRPVLASNFRILPGSAGVAWLVAVCFLLVGFGQLAAGALRTKRWMEERKLPASALSPEAKFSLPEQIGKWKRLSPEVSVKQKIETRGLRSDSWHFFNGGTVATVALDYPFRGYHDVTICYAANGWDVSEHLTRTGTKEAPMGDYVFVRMSRELLMRATLLFSTLDERGKWVDGSYVKRNLMERFREATADTTYRVQVLSSGFVPMSGAAEEDLVKLFEEARELLAQQLVAQMKGK